METKNSIRKEILSVRDGLSDKERASYSKNIADTVMKIHTVQYADNILAFVGYKSEVQTMELIESLLKSGKRVFLPRVNGEEMDFFRIGSLNDLKEGYKGIPEPDETCTEVFVTDDYENMDNTVMLMPGAVFAKDGSRIGYGKGYYDRFLTKYDIMNRIALCYSIQIMERIPTDAHDKKAFVIVTEKGITECRKV